MDRTSQIFCAAALTLALLIAAAAFPFAAMSRADVRTAHTPVSAERLGSVDLGAFGTVSVLDLVNYYMENPPAEKTSGAPEKKVRFQGC